MSRPMGILIVAYDISGLSHGCVIDDASPYGYLSWLFWHKSWFEPVHVISEFIALFKSF